MHEPADTPPTPAATWTITSQTGGLPTDLEVAAAREAAARALAEDLGPDAFDLTAPALAGVTVDGAVVARADGVVCGLYVAHEVCAQRGVAEVELVAVEGAWVRRGDILATVFGDAAAVLSAERVALNFLQRMSGIATLTRAYVDAVAGTGTRILDTRKTTPGLRPLERHAVRCGGGSNHRFGLFDVAMVKDNHVDAVGMRTAVERIRSVHPHVELVIEARTLEEVREALALGPQVILLDNMDATTMRSAVERIDGACLTEASGGITLDTVADTARTGVDRISIGALTHSAPSLDVALDLRSRG